MPVTSFPQKNILSSSLRLDNVTKKYGETVAIENICLQLEQGEHLSLTGPSGCGKSTILRIITGLEPLDGGKIYLHGECVSSTSQTVPSHTREVALVFQDLALWPHMNAREHISFTLEGKHYRGRRKKEKIEEIFYLVKLPTPLVEKFPHQLSGGEQQRLAIGRALAQEPKILLMDEPLSSMDLDLKESLMNEIQMLTRRLNITLIFVTHQWQEAIFMADKIAIMHKGQITSMVSKEKYRDLMQKKYL